MPAVFWLDADRGHDAQLIACVRTFLEEHETDGLEFPILAPVEATKFSLERLKKGQDTISVTGNVLRDYLTELPSVEHDHANFHIERASIKKDVRLALAFSFRDESFATNSHAQLNGRVNVTGSGFLDAGSELDSRLAELESEQ